MTENEINLKVDEVFKETELYSTPVEVIAIAKYYEFLVYELSMDDNISGMIISGEKQIEDFDSNKVIVVNANHSAARKRFTIAHELGHYILNNKPVNCYAHRDAGAYGPEEKEANSFASALLMPEKDVLNEIQMLKSNEKEFVPPILILHIANKFLVSESAAEVRLKKLGII